jgi:hypothetical protein
VIFEPLRVNDIGYVLFGVVWAVLPYWGIFVLAVLSDPTNPMHRWRIWSAWLLMSAPFAVACLMMFSDRRRGFEVLAFLPHALVLLSPVVALLGAVAGQLTWRLLRLLPPMP